jgi:hypothetical protein
MSIRSLEFLFLLFQHLFRSLATMSEDQRRLKKRLKEEKKEFERSNGHWAPSGIWSFGPVKSVVWDVDGSPETEKSATLAIDIVRQPWLAALLSPRVVGLNSAFFSAEDLWWLCCFRWW